MKTNVEDYVSTTHGNKVCVNDKIGDKCIGCAVCLKPDHKVLAYKYPKKLQSRYAEYYNNFQDNGKSKQKKTQSFNYD